MKFLALCMGAYQLQWKAKH